MGIRSACTLVAAMAAGCGGDADRWEPIADTPPTLINPIAVWAFSPTDVWFLDGSATVHRYDGSAWSTLDTPSTGGLACIYALSPSDVWLCAGDEVLHYDGATFTATDVSSQTGLDGLSALWAEGRDDVWVVGDDAIVARFDGTSWSQTITGSPFKSSIWGSGANDVYALSTFDLMHYDGTAWTEVEIDGTPAGGDGQVWGTSASDVWLVTGDERVAHFDGAAWTVTELNIVGDLAAIWGSSPADVWGAGGAGSIARFDGNDWSQVAAQEIGAPYLRQLLDVHGTSSDDVWVVGRQLGEGGSRGLIYHHGE